MKPRVDDYAITAGGERMTVETEMKNEYCADKHDKNVAIEAQSR